MKPDYVICVGGTPGHGWLTLPSDEQRPIDLIVTTDPEMVARYCDYAEAKPHFDALVAAHPRRQFSMMTLAPLGSDGETFETPNTPVATAR
ncbi:MAG: hypothetical protein Q8Q80_01390 [Methyloversatilis sp.]|uniref:hypothetical protein n=1 Tax=Methyloversatilis sp. TaxID=2569862 RepID=UPI0027347ADF|nr:hypothetical protein [Methyloversatilis sp.]MDP3871291.1 hypothetical protein [Methyloversatilis sp.]